jgi:AraC-like DNA-binding protein
VAADLGFYDQAHFTRHFKRHVAVTPARFARGRARPAGARPVADPRSPAG